MSTFKTLKFSILDNVATITLNRPEAANGINLQMVKELLEAALVCSKSKDVRSVLINGSGKMFSCGGDLKSFVGFGSDIDAKLRELTIHLHAAIACLRSINAPIIIAVNGTAAGAGMSIAVCGDYVLASDNAKFTTAYTGVGLSPDGSGSYFLPRLIGLRKTQELLLTNRVLTAREACDWGLVNRVVAIEKLPETSQALATQLANGPTRAYGSVKRLLNLSFESGLEKQMEIESQYISAMTQTADAKEGIQAFIEKRNPTFKGL